MAESKTQKTIVIGAGPVGTLAALYAAQRGHDVEVYELRSDLRDPSTVPLNFTKSINLALSERGIHAIRESGRSVLLEQIFESTIPMHGRMIHGKDLAGKLYEKPQDYDIHGRSIYAVDRGGLNKTLLDELDAMPNVNIMFNHKLTGADFKKHKAWFEVSGSNKSGRNREIEVDFDLMIGADGAHSAARYHMMKYQRMDYQQEYIDTLWCEFQIPAREVQDSTGKETKFRISPNHLHIWPGKEFMFIAIPSFDGSFTCTLFMPSSHFIHLEATPQSVPEFFDVNFPGVTTLITRENLIASFKSNPHLPLISIKCSPYHYEDSVVILGDAAHAMVPFYGQGMNAGLEDVNVLFSFIDSEPSKHIERPSPSNLRAEALSKYSEYRKSDAHVINDLALQNYVEMRASVVSPIYAARKWLEEKLSVLVPSLGWQTKYSRVSFGNERYSEVIRKSDRQGRLLTFWLVGLISSQVVLGGLMAWRRATRGRG
ncbi:Kynurenine 3-monooxygenase [Lachnellula suecica]|uniref:Kynurenine 3-monooxygenase n=1 Tax=Lachnellula suecica TaxID=602035 RepID=A0A8T9CJS3_9HELO|nr:Kynurenine 3-monooxygenase [Lachnellula suecica]